MPESYTYRSSIKSSFSDELINTYLLRPLAGVFVRVLYPTRVTPNQVTIASIAAGFGAAVFFLGEGHLQTASAGLLVTLKDVLDSADGQLARARGNSSRTGRFLDSIGDFAVDLAVFGAIGWRLFRSTGSSWMFFWCFLAFVGITLRVSYHVFYQASYLHLEGRYKENRISEEITDADRSGDRTALFLHRVFLSIYAWQDRLMLRIDEGCRGGRLDEDFRRRWYGDFIGLRLSGLLGFGTELFLLMLCSVANELPTYLALNLVVMNGVMAVCILYRRWVLRPRLTSSPAVS